jgi:hypothetical protein
VSFRTLGTPNRETVMRIISEPIPGSTTRAPRPRGRDGQPVISIDTKKKEQLDQLPNPGADLAVQRPTRPVKARVRQAAAGYSTPPARTAMRRARRSTGLASPSRRARQRPVAQFSEQAAAPPFTGRGGVRVLGRVAADPASASEHGKERVRQHGQGDVPVPGGPGMDLVVV